MSMLAYLNESLKANSCGFESSYHLLFVSVTKPTQSWLVWKVAFKSYTFVFLHTLNLILLAQILIIYKKKSWLGNLTVLHIRVFVKQKRSACSFCQSLLLSFAVNTAGQNSPVLVPFSRSVTRYLFMVLKMKVLPVFNWYSKCLFVLPV